MEVARQCAQKVRISYQTGGAKGHELAEDIITSFPTCPIPEIARLGRTLKQWKDALPECFTTGGSRHPTLEPRGTEPRLPGPGETLGGGITVRARVGDLIQPCRGTELGATGLSLDQIGDTTFYLIVKD